MKHLLFLILITVVLSSCVERGKPIQQEEAATQSENKKIQIDHYTCPKGHKGSDKQGTCTECSSVLVHNQAYHGSNLNIPTPALEDPFNSNTNTNSAPSPAQNAYGDYHYTCPNGHPGGAGSGGNCTTCKAKLIHNQLYHK